MNRILTYTILLLLSQITFGQEVDFENYIIRLYKIEKINKWNITIDSVGIKKDSSLTIFYFDTLGRKITKISNISNNGRLYDSTRYLYNKNGYLIDRIGYSPYVYATSGIYEHDSIKTTNYDSHHKIISEVKYYYGGTNKINEYHYATFLINSDGHFIYVKNRQSLYTEYEQTFNPDCRYFFSVKDKKGLVYCVVDTELIDFVTIKKNNLLIGIEKYEYFMRK